MSASRLAIAYARMARLHGVPSALYRVHSPRFPLIASTSGHGGARSNWGGNGLWEGLRTIVSASGDSDSQPSGSRPPPSTNMDLFGDDVPSIDIVDYREDDAPKTFHLHSVPPDAPYHVLMEEQINLERRKVLDTQKSEIHEVPSRGFTARQGEGKGDPVSQEVLELLAQWYEPLEEAIRQEQHEIINNIGSKQDRAMYGPYLLLHSADKLAMVTMHTLLGMMLREGEELRTTRLTLSVGTEVLQETQAECRAFQTRIAEKMKLVPKDPQSLQLLVKHEDPKFLLVPGDELAGYPKLMRDIPTDTSRGMKLLSKVKEIFENPRWEAAILAKVGGALVEMFLDTAAVYSEAREERVPAFTHGYKNEGPNNRKTIGVVMAQGAVISLIQKRHNKFGYMKLHTKYLPMIVEPLPWGPESSGGYFSRENPIMRTRGDDDQKEALDNGNLTNVYAGLNALAETPWKINRPVLDVIEKCWADGGGIADLPSRQDEPYPEPPFDLEKSMAVRDQYLKNLYFIQKTNRNLHSLRCDTVLKLDVAREFKNHKFYFPHNLDFRGRAYPIPPHLNHLGSDFCRSLLSFAEEKPLGEKGFSWLKVHAANLYGFDKVPFSTRENWVDDNIDDLIRASENPYDNMDFILKADSPWQFLACLNEIRNAVKAPVLQEYMSAFPVHMDGSCNGLQHYAALGRDTSGGFQVNLVKSDVPQDVYTGVCNVVKRNVEHDLAHGKTVEAKMYASLVAPLVERKVVKQTVMTSVYGVTFIGARKQIYGQLRERLVDVPDSVVYPASCYLANHTLLSLQELFQGARGIMLWLANCARAISRANQPVAWVTPLGLPIVQPYRKSVNFQVKTRVQHIVLANTSGGDKVSPMKQRSAFPPNFIHSLDSTHMLLTAIECKNRGVTFASVHDSYWTHAGSVDDMNYILRDKFVDLYSRPILEDLRDSFQWTYPNIEFDPLPERGDLDISQVRDSTYFFN